MNPQWQRYRELELIFDQSIWTKRPQAAGPSLPHSASWLRRLWHVFDLALLRNLEPRIWQSVDQQTGQTRWHIYDPDTGKTHHLNSDLEVRQWLEKIFQH